MDVTTDDLHDSEVYQQLYSGCLVRDIVMGYGRRWAVETAFPTYKYNILININT
jgi:hypothetical protein